MRLSYIILLFCFSVGVGMFAQSRSSGAVPKHLSAEERTRFDYYFFEANRLRDIGKHDAQLEALRMCLEIDSTNGVSQGEIGMLYAGLKNLPQASRALKKAVESSPENWWYRVQYISLLSGREQYQAAVEQALELKKYYPVREEVFTILTSLYKQTGEYDKAIEALNQLEKFVGINEYLTFEKFQLYTILNKEKLAVREFDRLIAKYPKETRYKVLLADIYLEQKQPKKAFEMYRQIREEDPDNPYVYVSLADYYNSQNQADKAVESIVSALKIHNCRQMSKWKSLAVRRQAARQSAENRRNRSAFQDVD